MPIAIYFEWMGGHSDVATFWVFVVILFSFVVILFVNMYAARTQRYRKTGADKDESRWGAEGKGAGKRKSAATDGAERGNEEVSP
jgi:molybdate transport system permease protein